MKFLGIFILAAVYTPLHFHINVYGASFWSDIL